MKIQLKLYGSSELLSGKGVLSINLPKNSKIKNLRSSLMNLIVKKKQDWTKVRVFEKTGWIASRLIKSEVQNVK